MISFILQELSLSLYFIFIIIFYLSLLLSLSISSSILSSLLPSILSSSILPDPPRPSKLHRTISTFKHARPKLRTNYIYIYIYIHIYMYKHIYIYYIHKSLPRHQPDSLLWIAPKASLRLTMGFVFFAEYKRIKIIFIIYLFY